MPLQILDTDVSSLLYRGDAQIAARAHQVAPSDLAVTVISVEEMLTGWYTLLRQSSQPQRLERTYRELADTVRFLMRFQILEFSMNSIQRYQHLLSQKLNVRKNDLRIAAIALEFGATLVTRNLRDFQRVPGLTVEDWSVP
jgi:tRNA(fMet)-specific endonuclease VapC